MTSILDKNTAILTLINADLCKNVYRHSNVFINTLYASGPLDLLTMIEFPFKCEKCPMISSNSSSSY